MVLAVSRLLEECGGGVVEVGDPGHRLGLLVVLAVGRLLEECGGGGIPSK